MRKAIGILQIISGAALVAAGILSIIQGSSVRRIRRSRHF